MMVKQLIEGGEKTTNDAYCSLITEVVCMLYVLENISHECVRGFIIGGIYGSNAFLK